jgi:hypothetical protein
MIIHSHTKNQVNISNHSEIKRTHGIIICVKKSLKTEVILPIAELIEIKIQTSLTSVSMVLLYCSPSSSAS